MKWTDIISQYMETEAGQQLSANIRSAKDTATISPDLPLLFRSYSEKLCPFEQAKIIIVGTEPNADPAIADGLCLSSKKPDYYLPETKQWYNWMRASCFPLMTKEQFREEVASPSVHHLAKQGIVFTNEHLSTYSGRPGSHRELGWRKFTAYMLAQISFYKEELNQPIMFVFLNPEADLEKYVVNHKNLHLIVEIANPEIERLYSDLDSNTRNVFIVMSNFIAEYYPEQARTFDCTFEQAFDWTKVEGLWKDFIFQNNIPMPAMPEGISQKMKDAIMMMNSKFDIYGTAGRLETPRATFKVGINYLKN